MFPVIYVFKGSISVSNLPALILWPFTALCHVLCSKRFSILGSKYSIPFSIIHMSLPQISRIITHLSLNLTLYLPLPATICVYEEQACIYYWPHSVNICIDSSCLSLFSIFAVSVVTDTIHSEDCICLQRPHHRFTFSKSSLVFEIVSKPIWKNGEIETEVKLYPHGFWW